MLLAHPGNAASRRTVQVIGVAGLSCLNMDAGSRVVRVPCGGGLVRAVGQKMAMP